MRYSLRALYPCLETVVWERDGKYIHRMTCAGNLGWYRKRSHYPLWVSYFLLRVSVFMIPDVRLHKVYPSSTFLLLGFAYLVS